DLVVGSHVGHRAAGCEVGGHDFLLCRGQNVCGLGHEVNAAEHHELCARPGGCLPGQFEGVASDVGELDDLVPLVVMTQDEGSVAECLPGRPGTSHESRVT